MSLVASTSVQPRPPARSPVATSASRPTRATLGVSQGNDLMEAAYLMEGFDFRNGVAPPTAREADTARQRRGRHMTDTYYRPTHDATERNLLGDCRPSISGR